MKIKATLRRPGIADIDVVITADGTARVGDVAGALYRADPRQSSARSGVVPGSGAAMVSGAGAVSGGGSVSGQGAVDSGAASVPDAGDLTLRVVDNPAGGAAARTFSFDTTVLDAGLRSGCLIELAPAQTGFEVAVEKRGPAAAVLRVLSGPDRGKEFPLPFGSSTVGRDRDVDVRLSDPLVSKHHVRVNVSETIDLVDLGSSNGVVINGAYLTRVTISGSDLVELGDTTVCVVPLQRQVSASSPSNPSIEFVRSPRVVPRYPGEEYPLPKPPQPPAFQRLPWIAAVSPVIMGVVLYLVTHQLLTILTIALSPLMLIGNFVDQRIYGKRQFKRASKYFMEAVEQTRGLLTQAQEVQRAVRLRESPSLAETMDGVRRMGSPLWTRRPEHPEFLTVRLGLGRDASRDDVKLPSEDSALAEHRALLRQLKQEFSVIDGVPIVADLRSVGALGVCGPAGQGDDVARSVVAQIVGLHSPAEVVLAVFASPSTRASWEWVRWLPHSSSPFSPLSGDHLSDGPGTASALLTALEAVVEERLGEAGTVLRGPLDPEKANEAASPIVPSIVVVIEDSSPVDRGRATRLAERGADANVHVVWRAASSGAIPAACRSFVELVAGGSYLVTVGQVRSGDVRTPVAVEGLDSASAGAFARVLAPVVDVGVPLADDSDLPRAVSYPELAGMAILDDPDWVVERWRENNSLTARDGSAPVRRKKEGTLRALVGHSGSEPFYLDLRAQGPHALVGGTTGAGKSEFLQSWVLGMAAAHSPDRLTFLFVDYKGGAAFADCIHLPHTVGLVTDLSTHLVRRALTSLRAELRHREHLLRAKGAKDLVSLEKTGDPDTPPSLVIVVDEFAALVGEVPEFVDGVVDVAQRGRSLGLHLVLATQRPAGVIKDNLRANTNLRIALRMADEGDSSDILDTPMAAHFDPSVPGRAAAKSGPGRLTTFQTGYVGGWTTDAPVQAPVGIQELAFGSGAEWDVPAQAQQADNSGPNDIARVVATVAQAAQRAQVPTPRKPWLNELAPLYDLTRLPNPRTDAQLLLGVRDDPAHQAQPTVFYEPDREGNIVFFGTGGSGKSTALRSLAIAAAVTPRGGPVIVYGLDFGANGLQMLEGLPHVGSIVPGDDDERVARLLRTLKATVDERAERYASVNAGSIVEYRALAATPAEPRILLLVDGIGAFREAYEYSAQNPWFTAFAQIAADGRPLGVHVAMTGERANALPNSISASVQRRIILRMATVDDYLALGVPGDVLDSSAPPGRGIYDGDEVQLAVLGSDSNVAVQAREIERLARSMARQPGVVVPEPVRRLPDLVELDSLPVVVGDRPAIGLSDVSLSAIGFDPVGAFMLTGTGGSGRTTALDSIARALRRARPDVRMVHIAPRPVPAARAGLWQAHAAGIDEVAELLSGLQTDLDAHPDVVPRVALLAENVTEFGSTMTEAVLDGFMKTLIRGGGFVVGEAESSTWGAAWGIAQPFKAARRGLVLVPSDSDGDVLFGTPLGRIHRAEFPPGRGFLVERGRAEKLQVGV